MYGPYYKYRLQNLHAHTQCIFYKQSDLLNSFSKSPSNHGKSILMSILVVFLTFFLFLFLLVILVSNFVSSPPVSSLLQKLTENTELMPNRKIISLLVFVVRDHTFMTSTRKGGGRGFCRLVSHAFVDSADGGGGGGVTKLVVMNI